MPCLPQSSLKWPVLPQLGNSYIDNLDQELLGIQYISRVARDKGSDPGSEGEVGAASPFWWCDPGQAGYGFFLAKGIKEWCKENAGDDSE